MIAHIGPRSGGGSKKSSSYGTGKETLRLRSKGPATVEDAVSSYLKHSSLLFQYF